MPTADEVPVALQNVLRTHLPYAGAGDLGWGDELAHFGLDSLGLVTLLADLEEQFDVELPDEFVSEETFGTVGSLWAALAPVVVESALAARRAS